jgi:hypothetical protein
MKHSFTAVFIIIAAALVAGGCMGGAAAGRLAESALARVAAREAEVAVAPTLSRITARSALLGGRTEVAVRSESEAAAALAQSPAMREVAAESDAKITAIAAEATTEPAARSQVGDCARAGVMSAAKTYATSYATGDGKPALDETIAGAVGDCLQRSFPGQAVAVRYLSEAIKNSVLSSSQEAGATQATAQDYVDWLVYCASLYQAQGAAASQGAPVAAPSATDVSIDNLLVVVYHAHAGRLAIASGDWRTAIANRIGVLNELSRLRVSADLEGARETLISAMRASLAADRYHAACGACAASWDLQATNTKRTFVRLFNPYLQARYGATIDETVL